MPKALKRPPVVSMAKASKILGMTDNVKSYAMKERTKVLEAQNKPKSPHVNVKRLSLTKSQTSEKSSKLTKKSPVVQSTLVQQSTPKKDNVPKAERMSGVKQVKVSNPSIIWPPPENEEFGQSRSRTDLKVLCSLTSVGSTKSRSSQLLKELAVMVILTLPAKKVAQIRQVSVV